MRRSEQRREAVFGIYQHDVTGHDLDASLPRGAHGFTRALAHATLEHRSELDAVIARHSHGWTIDRIAPLERAIMRVALLEMLYPDAVPAHEPIPAEGAIDEAVATAKDFCGADAPGFVNGVLDAALRELRENQATTL
jgi:N utilization substance protein B